MTREEKIKEIQRYLWDEVEGYDLTWEADCGKLAEKLYEDGWHRREKGDWSTKKIGDGGTTRTCSNCLITQTVNIYNGKVMFRYCPYCGAEMERDV
jgi:hypothetical protein